MAIERCDFERYATDGRGLVSIEVWHPDGARRIDITASVPEFDLNPTGIESGYLDPMIDYVKLKLAEWGKPA